MKQILNTPIDRAIGLMGGVAETVRKLGLKGHATVYQWRKTRVPAERCLQIELATVGLVRCEDLRPDVQWWVIEKRKTQTSASIAPVASESAAQGVAHV